MELKELFNALREHGITEITFKLAPVAVEKQETKSIIIDNAPAKQPTKVKSRRKTSKSKKLTPEQIAKIRAKRCPGFYTLDEIAKVCEVSKNVIERFIDVHAATYKHGRLIFYKLENVYDKRAAYEADILKNDGHRRGPVKFFADRMIELAN